MEPRLRTLNPAQRKPYVTPKLTVVELRPEEAVLGFCKTGLVSGPIQDGCLSPTQCYNEGS